MSAKQGHKWFAAFWERFGDTDDEIRREIAGGATGRVLEIGAGTGFNFRYYREEVESVTATDPDPFMLKRAQRRAREAPISIELRQSLAQELPFEDASFDTVVSTWVLCTVEDLEKALSETRRVLKPEGQLRFVEHVRFQNSFAALCQDIATPVWRRVGAGCHPNRDIEQAITEGGFRMQEVHRYGGAPPIPPAILVRPHVKGVAVPA